MSRNFCQNSKKLKDSANITLSEKKTKISKYKTYRKQQNYIVSLLRNEKKAIIVSNLDMKFVNSNWIFWKTVKSFLYESVTKHPKINVFEYGKLRNTSNSLEQESILKLIDKHGNSIKLIKTKYDSQFFRFSR